MIDLHSHVLPGIDDGPATLAAALALVDGARADGIRTIVATPHVDWTYPAIDSTLVHASVGRLQAHCLEAGIDIRIVPGGEVAATRALDLGDAELGALTLGGAGWLLLETPIGTPVPGFAAVARELAARGHRVLLAHPERSALFMRSPSLLDELVDEGMLAQVTAGSLSGRFGRTVREFALDLLERGAVHVVASDAHGRHRPARIAGELQGMGIEPLLLRWLAQDVPLALLEGAPPPPRPEIQVRRRRPRRFLRLVTRSPTRTRNVTTRSPAPRGIA